MSLIKNLALGLAVGTALLAFVVAMVAAANALASWWAILALLSVFGAGGLLWNLIRGLVPRRTILQLDLERRVIERVPAHPLGKALTKETYVLRDIVEALERAAQDKRVVGLVTRLGESKLGVARAQELRGAIANFVAAGKSAVAYAETMGESGETRSLPEMLVASAFNEFYLQPGGNLFVQGVQLRPVFVRRLFDKLGVGVRFDHRREYKSAMYRLTEDHMPEPEREASQAIAQSQFDQLAAGIATGRQLDEATFHEAVDRAPLLASEAKEVGLVDDLLYRDEVVARVEEGWGRGAKKLAIGEYLRRAGRPHRRGPTVALIYGTGAITRGKSRFDPLTRALSMGSDDVAKAFRTAIENKRVKAVVFRVDSPGGSASASEVIRREVDRAREAGKPVIVSMGDLAGSGGYWVSVTANKILAQPGTITGSIGVVTGKLITKDAWARLGVTFDEVHVGEHAGFGTPDRDYTDSEWERIQAQLDTIYEEFIRLVGEGRRLAPQAVEEVARGRIWSGSEALGRGLVDELGGLERSYRVAAEAAGLDPTRFRVRVFPKPLSRAVRLLKRGGHEEALAELARVLEPTAALAEELRGVFSAGALSMPGFTARL